MPQVLAFIGYHDSGKTTLMRKVFRELSSRGYSVAIMKSTKHHVEPFSKSGSDTDLYRSEGAEKMALVTPAEVVSVKPNEGQAIGALASSLFPEVDLVLCEGFKSASDVKKIEVARSGVSETMLKDEVGGVIAVVSDFHVKGSRSFAFDEIQALCDYVEDVLHLPDRRTEDDIHLIVDGRKIPMKRFVRDSMKGTVCGYVASLRFTENAKTIEVFIRLKK